MVPDENSMEDPLCNSSFGSMVNLDYVTPDTIDEYARVMVENDASKLYEASPWAADKRAAEIVRPAPVQAADSVPPKSLARDMAFAKVQSRIMSAAAEAVQAAKLHNDNMLP